MLQYHDSEQDKQNSKAPNVKFPKCKKSCPMRFNMEVEQGTKI